MLLFIANWLQHNYFSALYFTANHNLNKMGNDVFPFSRLPMKSQGSKTGQGFSSPPGSSFSLDFRLFQYPVYSLIIK